MDDTKLIRPELLVLIPILNIIGKMIKGSRINNKDIPFLLGVIAIFLSGLLGLANGEIRSAPLFIFESITQGILLAGASVYGHQVYCSNKKK